MKRFNWVFRVCLLTLLLNVGCDDSDSVIGAAESPIDQATVHAITTDMIAPVVLAADLSLLLPPAAQTGRAEAGAVGETGCQDSSEMCASGTVDVCAVSETAVEFIFADCFSHSGATINGSISVDFAETSVEGVYAVSFDGLMLNGSLSMEEEGNCRRVTLDQFSAVTAQHAGTVDASLLYCGAQWPGAGSFDMSVDMAQSSYSFEVVFDDMTEALMTVSDLSGELLGVCSVDFDPLNTTCEMRGT